MHQCKWMISPQSHQLWDGPWGCNLHFAITFAFVCSLRASNSWTTHLSAFFILLVNLWPTTFNIIFQEFTCLSNVQWSIWSQWASQLPLLDFNSCEPWIKFSWSRVDFTWCLYWTAFPSFGYHSSFAFSSEIQLQYITELKIVNLI